MLFLCPKCKKELNIEERICRCDSGHSYDRAKEGYVHLLPANQKNSKAPGDDKGMVAARRAFLDKGFYAPLRDALCALAAQLSPDAPVMLDAGCGEGYYSAGLAESLNAELLGLDISKEAVRCAAAKYKNARWLCASAARLPVKDGSVGLLTSLFALTLPEEFRRVLRPDGTYLQVLAAEDHLLNLKNIIYPELHHKEKFLMAGMLDGERLSGL